MAKDEIVDIRWQVASHANTPIALLDYLAKDVDASVRMTVAMKVNIPLMAAESVFQGYLVNILLALDMEIRLGHGRGQSNYFSPLDIKRWVMLVDDPVDSVKACQTFATPIFFEKG